MSSTELTNNNHIEIIHDPKSKYWKIDHITKAKYCQPTNQQYMPRLESSRNICKSFSFKCLYELCGHCPDFKPQNEYVFERKHIINSSYKKDHQKTKSKLKTKKFKIKITDQENPLSKFI